MTSQRTRDRLVARLREAGIRDPRVLEVLRRLPRHLFVDEALASHAYEETALPIGFGQTLSQPYVVARMTEALLEEGPLDKVLEVGTGSGYQAAVLACLVREVVSVERIQALVPPARRRLRELGLHNVRVRHADGRLGWPPEAPYGGILLAAAPERLPEELLAQLAPGGRLVAPVGPSGAQSLLLVRREPGGGWSQRLLGPASFVPLRPGAE
ncbi:MAG: protein-L-isoaspartate(D-aspartate) O-methyltransferase [Gammaproteobacteria bacterium]|nr:MAG: protein-L-isoaspartate(D-aspartate) O-methyltransferase [Gammaproteobacteria bacterium]